MVPLWLDIAYRAAGIVSAIGGAWAFFFVVWPAIRIQTKFIKDQEKKAVDDLIDKL